MVKRKKRNKINLFKLLVIVISWILILYLIFTLKNVKDEKEYYKEQMLNFCELSQLQAKIINYIGQEVPIIPNCEDYILSWDGGE